MLAIELFHRDGFNRSRFHSTHHDREELMPKITLSIINNFNRPIFHPSDFKDCLHSASGNSKTKKNFNVPVMAKFGARIATRILKLAKRKQTA